MTQWLLRKDLDVLDVKGQLFPDIAVDGDLPCHVLRGSHDDGLEGASDFLATGSNKETR